MKWKSAVNDLVRKTGYQFARTRTIERLRTEGARRAAINLELFRVEGKVDDERRFLGKRGDASIEFIPVDPYPETLLRIQTPRARFEERLQYSHLGLAKVLTEFEFASVLDIGSGPGTTARAFKFLGLDVQAVEITVDHGQDVVGDYVTTAMGRQFDLVWCSHVVEHQRNLGMFLDKVFNDTHDNGVVAITVPSALSPLIVGHAAIFTPLLLLYHMVLAGFDCREARLKCYDWQFTVIVKRRPNGIRPSNVAATHFSFDAPNYYPELREWFPVSIGDNGHAWGEIDAIAW